jgi:hypothetical protein
MDMSAPPVRIIGEVETCKARRAFGKLPPSRFLERQLNVFEP